MSPDDRRTDVWTESAVPSQTERTVVITGGNTGLGFETARVLAARGASVVLAVRNLDKGKDAAARLSADIPGADVSLQRLDLSSLDSVHSAAEELRTTYDKVDLLINNAGVMFTPRGVTTDGFELQLGTNHLGHFALTGLLIDRLLPVAGSRVVTLSSVGHRMRARIHFDDLQLKRGYSRFGAYGQSKLANLLFTYELQRRLAAAAAPTIALAAHPGAANTELVRNSPAPLRIANSLVGRFVSQAPPMGALPALRAATAPGVLGGQYYGPGGFQQVRGYPKLVESSAQSHDADLQQRLWAVSEELTGITYPV
jgi:NAD(P)-dependent dehydrogenase (short-subunit alcohol dehydrogenase family)